MHTLGHDFVPPPLHAGGLRYHGAAPMISGLVKAGVVEARAYRQNETFEAAVQFARTEGIIPAPESAHAIRAAIEEALAAKEAGEERTILFGLSGHGHFDLAAYDAYLGGTLEDPGVLGGGSRVGARRAAGEHAGDRVTEETGMRQDIEFDAEGTTLRGWLYVPDDAAGPAPTIVMCHGYSAVKELFLDAFAEVFCEAGFCALVYDNRNLGASDGEPRQEIDPWAQVATTATRSPSPARSTRSTATGSASGAPATAARTCSSSARSTGA